jgi:aldose 1-epimerase
MEKKHIPENKCNSFTKFFGNHPEGEVSCITLSNSKGTQARILTYGAVLQSFQTVDLQGNLVDVVLGFDTIEDYMKSYDLPAPPYFGAIVGRHAGRIDHARFSINNHTYQLEANNNAHSLHGGKLGLSRKLWQMTDLSGGENPTVTLTCVSPHMEDGFPGELTVTVAYTLTENDELFIEMSAATTKDTIVNLTHHSYFNMDGHRASIDTQKLYINAAKITESTAELIPTGNFLPLQDTVFDFRNTRFCPKQIDTTFSLDGKSKPAAFLESEQSGLRLNVYTDQPAVHVYVGGDLFGRLKGKDGAAYHSLSGLCFETQKFPNAPNLPAFPSTVLKAEDTYTHRTIYQLQSILS